jgi:hypothetical protein
MFVTGECYLGHDSPLGSMRLLFTIPHFGLTHARSADGRKHGPGAADLTPRVQALAPCFEAGLNTLVPRVYVDGDLAEGATAPFQNVHDSGPLTGEVLGRMVQFQPALNPHSGCFFLNARQLEHWARQPHFTDHESRFLGPLESAATLGIIRTSKVYRPAVADADFPDVQHFGTGYLEQLVQPHPEDRA